MSFIFVFFFFFQAEDGIRDVAVTGVQTCALPISLPRSGRHHLLEVIMPASTPRLQSPCPLPRRAFLSAAAAAAGGLALACVDRATGVAMLPQIGRASCRERV